uniref:Peptidase family T4 protein n=1 Tax=Toxoplasma gondii COUG TaxID=1074873 RepID=A0A2G8Y7G5_TOXGO|nr:peptidase family T4 protein [Toxoplasma gondii COUG]
MWAGSGVAFLCHVEKSALQELESETASSPDVKRQHELPRTPDRGEKATEQAEEKFVTGASFFAFDRPLAAVGRLFGSAPATRDFSVVQIGNSVQSIHGLLLGGGSVFGLDAVGGLVEFQRKRGIGVSTIAGPIPVCPALGIFDVPALAPDSSFPASSACALPQFVKSEDVATACAEAERRRVAGPASAPESDSGDRRRERGGEKERSVPPAVAPLRVRCRFHSSGSVSTVVAASAPSEQASPASAGTSREEIDPVPVLSTLPEETVSWIGSVGVGVGATCARVGECAGFAPRKGGWGEASRYRAWRGELARDKATGTGNDETLKVQAFVVVNSYGDVVATGKDSENAVVAGPLKNGVTFAASELLQKADHTFLPLSLQPQATTLVAVFTNLDLSRDALWRVAAMAGAGMARAIHPVFSPVDGDAVIAVSTGELTHGDTDPTLSEIIVGTMAAECVAEAIQRAAAAANKL